MFRDLKITPEEEEKMIRKIAERIHEYGMDFPAILMLEIIKPLAFIGGQMGRIFVSPLLPAFGGNVDRGGEKFLRVFEKRENVGKLIAMLEEMEKGKKSKAEEEAETEPKTEAEEPPPKRGWRRYLPF